MPKILKNLIFASLEYLLVTIFKVVLPRKPLVPVGSFKTLAFIECNGLGDHATVVGALRYLSEHFGSTKKIYFLCSPQYQDLFKDIKNIEILPIQTPWSRLQGKYYPPAYFPLFKTIFDYRKKYNFDVFIDTRGDVRRAMLGRALGARFLVSWNRMLGGRSQGFTGKLNDLVIPYPTLEMKRGQETLYMCRFFARFIGHSNTPDPENFSGMTNYFPIVEQEFERKGIVLHLGAGWVWRMWPTQSWQALVRKLLVTMPTIPLGILLGPGEEEMLTTFLSLFNEEERAKIKIHRLPIKDLPTLFVHSLLFIGADSGPLHLADACGCHIVGIYGPGNIRLWAPMNRGVFSIIHKQKDFACAPCSQRVCLYPQKNCVASITVDEIFDLVSGSFST